MDQLTLPQNQGIIHRLQQQAERANGAAAAAQPTNQKQITAAQDRIRELQHQLKNLPEQARTLKLAGKGKEARETLDVLEDVHIEVGKAQIELARLEAARADAIRRAHQEASAGANAAVTEALQLAEQIKLQADRDLTTIRGLAGQMELQGSNYQQAAQDARRKLQDAQTRLQTQVDGPAPAPKAPGQYVERAINLTY